MKPGRRRLLLLFVGGAGLLLAAVLTAYFYVTSAAGNARLRRLVVDEFNRSLAGSLEVASTESQGTRILLHGLVFRDPQGRVVAEIERADLLVSPFNLIHKQLRIEDAKLDGVKLHLKDEPGGLNLARVFEEKTSSDAGQSPSTSSPFSLHVNQFQIACTFVEFEEAHPSFRIRFGKLVAKGGGHYASVEDAAGSIELAAEMALPVPGTAQAKVEIVSNRSGASATFGADVQLSPGAGQLSVQGKLLANGSREMTARIQHANLAKLFDGPTTDLAGLIKIEGTGDSPATFEGAATAEIARSEIEGAMWGPVVAEARGKRGLFTLSRLSAAVPGLELTARGNGIAENGDVQGQVKIAKLSQTAKVMARFLGPQLDIDAGGELSFTAKGPWTRPAIVLEGRFREFRYGTVVAKGLQVDARIPDARRAWQSTGSLSIDKLRLLGNSFKNVQSTLTTRPRAFEVRVSAKGLSNISAFAAGSVDPRLSRVQFDDLRFELPEGTWQLFAPFNLFLDNLTLEPLELRSDRQIIRAELAIRKKSLRGSVAIRDLDLSRLPKAIVRADLNLGGTLNASVLVGGTQSAPELKVNLSMDRGQIQDFTGITAKVDGIYRRSRVNGRLQISAPTGKLESDFDIPIDSLIGESSEPISVQLAISDLQLVDVNRLLKQDGLLAGTASLTLKVSGRSDNPKVQLTVDGRQVAYRDYPAMDGKLGLTTVNDGDIAFNATLSSGKSRAEVAVTTEYTIRRLRRHAPSASDLLHDAFSAELAVHDLDMVTLGRFGIPQAATGSVDLRAKISGSLSKPIGTVDGQVAGITFDQFPETHLTFNVHTDGREVAASVHAQSENRTIGDASALFKASVLDLLQKFSKVPLEATATASGWRLAWFRSRAIDGQASANFTLRGNLENPSADLAVRLDEIGVASVPAGRAEVTMKYSNQDLAVEAALSSKTGSMNIAARSKVDLSFSSVKKGIAVSEAPLNAKLRAQAFDLSTLTGISPTIQLIGGLLAADGSFEGSLAKPKFQGNLEWTEGLLAIEGYGHYGKVHLALSATEAGLKVNELYAESTGGNVTFSGEATRFNEQFTFKGQTKAKEFPLVVDNQLLAVVSLNSQWSGLASAKLIDVQNLELSDARINLPEQRKDLQSLDRPSDVSLVSRGKPLDLRKGRATQAAPVDLPTSPPGDRLQFWAIINAPRNIWLKSSDIDAELGLSDGFRVEISDRLSISGTIRVLRGRVEIFGRRLELDKDSTVEFVGPIKLPSINATGIYKNEREQVTVYVNVNGIGKDLTIKTSSEPPLTETEIYTLLATGRRTLKHGTGSSITGDQAVSALGAVLATEATKLFAKKLPLDIITLESGAETGSGLRVEAGKYLSERVYLGGTVRFGADPLRYENSYAARLEYQLSRRWGLETELGDARQAGDLVWSKDF